MFAILSAHKHAEEDRKASTGSIVGEKLDRWCTKQRAVYQQGRLSSDRVARLEQLGFVWNPRVTSWEVMFVALAAYRQSTGNCSVPARWKDNPKLATWCNEQRVAHNSGKLSDDRINRLQEIGFRFSFRSHRLSDT